MFRIAFLVEDKNLAKALIAVDGIALNLEQAPVRNAMPVKEGKVTKVKEAGKDDKSLKAKLVDWLKVDKAGQRITAPELASKFEALGGNRNTVNSAMMKSLLDSDILTRISRGQFLVAG